MPKPAEPYDESLFNLIDEIESESESKATPYILSPESYYTPNAKENQSARMNVYDGNSYVQAA